MAPKGKKGKGGKGRGGRKKKEPLTDEQKRKVAEQKALAEKEKLQQRRELTKAFLKVKKDKEYELVKLNNNKLLDLWRPHLRKQKIKELLEDYQFLQLAFQRAYDQKNDLLQDLEARIGKNEEEYDAAVDMHMENIDKIMEFFRKRLKEVGNMYMDQKQKLTESLNEEKLFVQNSHNQNVMFLKRAMDKVNKQYSDANREADIDTFAKTEDLKNTLTQDVYLFRNKVDRKVASCWEMILERIVAYTQFNEEKKEEWEEQTKKDEKLSAIIDAQFQRLRILKDGIQQMDKKTEVFKLAYDRYVTELKEKKDACRERYNELIGTRNKHFLTTKNRIAHLALTAHDVLRKMDQTIVSRERILRTAERCRKCERIEEKVDPFLRRWGLNLWDEEKDEGDGFRGESNGDEEINTHDPSQLSRAFTLRVGAPAHSFDCDCIQCTCEAEDDTRTLLNAPITSMLNTYGLLERFWVRYNKVAIEREALRYKYQMLQKDNYNLRLTLRNYMGGMNPPSLDVLTFSNEQVEKTHSTFEKMMKMMMLESKRKERCRKVGGLKVH